MTSGLLFSVFFLLAYAYIATAHKKRGFAIWLAVVLALLSSLVFQCFAGWNELAEIAGGINFSVLLIFSGILLIAEVLIEAGIPGHLAGHIVNRSRNYGHAAIYLCILSSVISIFVENVATVMIVAPVALEVARKLKASPVVLLIGIAVASNLQGTATLVGDPPSMILAASEGMDFNDFFFMDGKPGIFFAVQLGAIASFIILMRLLKKDSRPLPEVTVPQVSSWIPAWILGGVIMGLAVLSFFFPGVGIQAGLLCLAGGTAAVVWHALYRRGRLGNKGDVEHGDRKSRDILRHFDWDTLFLLGGIFFMVGALEEMGVMEKVGVFLAGVSGHDPLMAFLLVVFSAVVLSAFVDNVPYVTAMIPVTHAIASSLEGGGSHYYLTFGLLIGACLGGNISPVGAAANIVSVSVLRKNGFKVSFMDFVRVGLPFTLAATAAGGGFHMVRMGTMMMKFNWKTAASATSVIRCGGEDDLREARKVLKEWEAPFLVVDSEVSRLWNEDLQPLIATSSGIYVMEAREVLKNTFTLSQIWDSMAAAGITRDTPVVVIGGGLVCDSGALAAATYLRGLRLVLVPTTLLCMVDACLGGKTGVNLSGAKNQVGTFCPAESVVLCTAFLKTLPEREFRSGMAEVIKTALIGDEELGRLLQRAEPRGETLQNVVTRCLAVKGRIVEEDLEDRGSRMVLNMGHTVGHALESCSGFSLSHGEAVGLGMLAEAAMAVSMGGDRNLPGEIRSLLRIVGLPTGIGPDISMEELESLLMRDKKSLRCGRIWALPFNWCDCRLVCISSKEEKEMLPVILRLLKV